MPSTPTGALLALTSFINFKSLIRDDFTGELCLQTESVKRAYRHHARHPCFSCDERPYHCSYCCGACVSKLPLLLRYAEHTQAHPVVEVVACVDSAPAPAAGDAAVCKLPRASVLLPEKFYMPQPHVEVWMKPGCWQVSPAVTRERARCAGTHAASGALQMPRLCGTVRASVGVMHDDNTVFCSGLPPRYTRLLLSIGNLRRRCRYSRAGFSFLAQAEDEDVLPDPSLVDDR
jgi:hypothetical protein